MITYSELSKEQKLLLIDQLRAERSQLLIESRKKTSKKTRSLPNLQFKSPELKALFDNMTDAERNSLLGGK